MSPEGVMQNSTGTDTLIQLMDAATRATRTGTYMHYAQQCRAQQVTCSSLLQLAPGKHAEVDPPFVSHPKI